MNDSKKHKNKNKNIKPNDVDNIKDDEKLSTFENKLLKKF